jgi:hypothetical protein
MNKLTTITSIVLVSGAFTLASCSMEEEKPKPAVPAAAAPAAKAEAKAAPAEKAPAKAKVEKASGDIGLLDNEKNYLILVTKQGKLVTLDFDNKTKVTKLTPTPGKISDIGLGSSATVTYTTEKDKNVATSLEYRAAKGGD